MLLSFQSGGVFFASLELPVGWRRQNGPEARLTILADQSTKSTCKVFLLLLKIYLL